MKQVCVFCGSMSGVDPAYADAARELGRLLAGRGIAVVYGGGRVGIMGALADATLAADGQVIGVIPKAMVDQELANHEVTELHIVRSMHERKALMESRSDAFIALPGGFGTLDELFEALTWSQLGLHHKPCGILNVNGYFDGLLGFLDHAAAHEFIPSVHRAMLLDDVTPAGLLAKIDRYLEGSPHGRIRA
jgi:uncharacterized protein (TIGR00730 family)